MQFNLSVVCCQETNRSTYNATYRTTIQSAQWTADSSTYRSAHGPADHAAYFTPNNTQRSAIRSANGPANHAAYRTAYPPANRSAKWSANHAAYFTPNYTQWPTNNATYWSAKWSAHITPVS